MNRIIIITRASFIKNNKANIYQEFYLIESNNSLAMKPVLLSDSIDEKTNKNIINLISIINALDFVKDSLLPVFIYNDSKYCIEGIIKKKRKKNVELFDKINELIQIRLMLGEKTHFIFFPDYININNVLKHNCELIKN